MRSRPIRALASSLLIAIGLATVLKAQTTTSGGLTGVINDQTKAVVPDAIVKIKDEAKGTIQTTKTAGDGVYRFFFLSPARYTLTVSHQGFQEQTRGVNVLLGPPAIVNLTLEIAKATSKVTVTDEALPDREWRHLSDDEPAADFRSPESGQ